MERKAHDEKGKAKLGGIYLMNNPQSLPFKSLVASLQISFDCPGSIKIVPIGKPDVRNKLGKLPKDSLPYDYLHSK